MGCWDSVSTRDFNALVLAGWNYGEKKDHHSALAMYYRIVSQPAPAKGAARGHYLMAANNACHAAMQVDDVLAAKLAEMIAPVGPDNPSIFYNCACAYANVGNNKKALAQVKLAIKHGYNNVRRMLADESLKVLESIPEFA
ncbi:MAG: hypothetical protein GY811_05225 [Myxococcales bacterium]|nr:hypothetical protein [Myxococcales bacterium]